MNENPSALDGDGEEFQPVRTLSVVIAVAQCVGAGVSLLVGYFPGWFENLWFGGALVTYPGYLLGLAVQRHLEPSSLGENRALVRRMGLVSAVLTLSALAVPLGALDVS